MSHPADIDAVVRQSLRYLGPDPDNWVPATPGVDHDVVIVGGGQSGVAIAFALRRAGIPNVTVIDAATEGREGVWHEHARMLTLRTPKTNLGPDLGIPALTFQAWYEAQYGAQSYADVGRIPRTLWAEYVAWLRRSFGVEVRFGSRLVRIAPENGHLRLVIARDGAETFETTRKLVLATGYAGGGFDVPAVVKSLPPHLWCHSHEAIDFSALRGKRIAVLGAAASAFDSAASALEEGAGEVHLYCRQADLARGTRLRLTAYPGFDNFHLLPDQDRWRVIRLLRERTSTAPADSVLRATRFPNFHLHLGAPWDAASAERDRVIVKAEGGHQAFDFTIVATGFQAAPAERPEFTGFVDRIAVWADRFTPQPEDQDAALAGFPYLGHGYELQESQPGTAPFLKDIHLFAFAAFMSCGRLLGDIASLKAGVPRLVAAIGRDFFLADRDHHLRRVAGDAPPDLTGEEYAHAIWRVAAAEAAE